jgi:hypothetical protein
MTDQIPTQIPPGAGDAVTAAADSAPTLAAPDGGAAAAAAGAASGPALDPSEAGAKVGAAAVSTTWQSSKKVTALWSINQNCNSWVAIEGIGWKRLFAGIETSTMALSIIAASAKATQRLINYREEPDGMIHEIYAL